MLRKMSSWQEHRSSLRNRKVLAVVAMVVLMCCWNVIEFFRLSRPWYGKGNSSEEQWYSRRSSTNACEGCWNIWTGDVAIQPPQNATTPRISLVISHCQKDDIDWLQTFTAGYTVSETTVYSKCNHSLRRLPFPNTKLVRLPNVGRCDHSYAHHINHNYHQRSAATAASNEVTFFLKDDRDEENIRTGQTRALEEMLQIVQQNAFACGLTLELGKSFSLSVYHHTKTLESFHLDNYSRPKYKSNQMTITPFKSPYQNLGSFAQAINFSFSKDLTMVCYGGWFAATQEAIRRQPKHVWQNLELALSRGDNLEEGHLTERSWAGLLANPISNQDLDLLTEYADAVLEALCLPGPLLRSKDKNLYQRILNLNETNIFRELPMIRF